ncbi:MAG: zinc metalloprotease HtpX [Pseudomonadota bacterium]
MSPFLSPERQAEHKARNDTHTLALLGGIGLLMIVCAWLIWSWIGIPLALGVTALMYWLAPRIPAATVMKLYNAKRVDPRGGSQLIRLLDALADRAELPARPALYIVPSMTLNAFATGSRERSAIALTEGLMRSLSMAEITGVLAHEVSHVRNNDLRVMGLADAMSRFTLAMSYLAIALAVLNIIGLIGGFATVSWLGIALLYFAPALTSLLQLALSRTREFDADLEAANLTGRPSALASALQKLERYQGRAWEDMMLPVPARRIPHPSVLRTHPPTHERVARLRALEPRQHLPEIGVIEEPLVSLAGFGPIEMRPRYRWPGVWY